MKLAICNELFAERSFAAFCAFVAGLGYQGVELAPFTLEREGLAPSPAQRREIVSTARRAGLEIIGLHWLLASPPGMHLTHPDRALRERTGQRLADLTDLCADLGGKVMVLGSPKQRSLLPGISRAMAEDFLLDALAMPLERAAARDVVLALEPLGPAETDFLNTAEEARALMRRAGHSALGLHLDVKAMASEQKPIAQIIEESRGRIAHVHVNDPNMLGPGMGKVKFEPIIAALRQAGYDGWLSVEAFKPAPTPDRPAFDPEDVAKRSIAYLKSVGV